MNNGMKAVPVRHSLTKTAFVVSILIASLVANIIATEFGLTNLFGAVTPSTTRAVNILTMFICGIDLLAIAALFAPVRLNDRLIWRVFGIWLIATLANAFIAWRGITVATIRPNPMPHWEPVLIAAIVWLGRVAAVAGLAIIAPNLFLPNKKPSK